MLFTVKEVDRSYKAKELQGENALEVLTLVHKVWKELDVSEA